MNIYDVNKTFVGQVYSNLEKTGYKLVYSLDNDDITISLNSSNTIWEFGDIKDKNVIIG
jgi:hypothetical protein